MSKEFIRKYLNNYTSLLQHTEDIINDLITIKNQCLAIHNQGKKLMIIGNGGSAAIASHVSVDLTKNAKIRCINFNESDLITCFANDFGYEEWHAQAIAHYADPGDGLIAISSSGNSKNILNACKKAKEKSCDFIVTLSGFNPNNPLKQLGDINLHINSNAYNMVENIHQFWLLTIVDLIIGKTDYPAN